MPTSEPLELVIILVIALLILGPGKLPEVGAVARQEHPRVPQGLDRHPGGRSRSTPRRCRRAGRRSPRRRRRSGAGRRRSPRPPVAPSARAAADARRGTPVAADVRRPPRRAPAADAVRRRADGRRLGLRVRPRPWPTPTPCVSRRRPGVPSTPEPAAARTARRRARRRDGDDARRPPRRAPRRGCSGRSWRSAIGSVIGYLLRRTGPRLPRSCRSRPRRAAAPVTRARATRSSSSSRSRSSSASSSRCRSCSTRSGRSSRRASRRTSGGSSGRGSRWRSCSSPSACRRLRRPAVRDRVPARLHRRRRSTAAIDGRPYFDFVTTLFLAFGLIMEFPIVLVGLSRVGIVTSDAAERSRRIVILGIAIFAAVATPGGDLVSPIVLGVTMYVLFELTILFIRRTRAADRRRPRRRRPPSAERPS